MTSARTIAAFALCSLAAVGGGFTFTNVPAGAHPAHAPTPLPTQPHSGTPAPTGLPTPVPAGTATPPATPTPLPTQPPGHVI